MSTNTRGILTNGCAQRWAFVFPHSRIRRGVIIIPCDTYSNKTELCSLICGRNNFFIIYYLFLIKCIFIFNKQNLENHVLFNSNCVHAGQEERTEYLKGRLCLAIRCICFISFLFRGIVYYYYYLAYSIHALLVWCSCV